MRAITILATATMLAACGSAASDTPVKRQPGSWGQTIQIVRLDGKGLDASAKQQMQQMFDMFGKMTVCVTPEQAAGEDVGKNMEKLGAGGGECKVEKQRVAGETVDFAATCKKNGETIKLAVAGTSGSTKQDLTIKVTPAGQTVASGMEMHVTAERRGECTANDIRVPDNAAAPAL